ncbi:MAG: DNA polymerase IV [Clostridia bacterium]
MEKTILHCDLNNFYASVAAKAHPEYDGLPLAVSGNPKERHGIILAKNMLAKADGVKTGEAIWVARQKCPNLVCLEPNFEEYVRVSAEVFQIYSSFTDRVERFGIDECWLDVTGSLQLFGSGKEIADKLRGLVKEKLGLTISVGVSFTKVLAKLGSDLKKPDATTVLSRDNYMQIIGKMSPSELIMIGGKTNEKLKNLNIHTIQQLANANLPLLRQHFGVVADNMVNSARGIETDEVKNCDYDHIPKSISNGTTTPRDIETLDDAKIVIYALSELVAVRMRKFNLTANGIALSLRYTDLSGSSRQTSLPSATSNASAIAETAIILLKQMHNFAAPLRAITVAAIRLSDKAEMQFSLFDESLNREGKLEESIDKIRGKYGYHSVKRGVLLQNDLATNLHDEDEFKPFQK